MVYVQAEETAPALTSEVPPDIPSNYLLFGPGSHRAVDMTSADAGLITGRLGAVLSCGGSPSEAILRVKYEAKTDGDDLFDSLTSLVL